MKRASFDVLSVDARVVWVVDRWGPRKAQLTVTNDAEHVVEILHTLYPGRRIMARDTGAQWAELLHDGPVFHGWAPVPDEFRPPPSVRS